MCLVRKSIFHHEEGTGTRKRRGEKEEIIRKNLTKKGIRKWKQVRHKSIQVSHQI